MSYEMSKETRKKLIEMLDSREYETEPYECTNEVLLRALCLSIGINKTDSMICICYEILQRHGYNKNDFVNKIYEERIRQEELHPYNEKTCYELILIEEYGEAVKAYNELDENGMIDELIQFVAVKVRIMEIDDYI